MSGKGSTRRPQQISDEEMERRWRQAFGEKRRKSWQETVAEAWDEVHKERPDLFDKNETLESKKA